MQKDELPSHFLNSGGKGINFLVNVGVGSHGIVGVAYDALDVLWTCTCGGHAGAEGMAG